MHNLITKFTIAGLCNNQGAMFIVLFKRECGDGCTLGKMFVNTWRTKLNWCTLVKCKWSLQGCSLLLLVKINYHDFIATKNTSRSQAGCVHTYHMILIAISSRFYHDVLLFLSSTVNIIWINIDQFTASSAIWNGLCCYTFVFSLSNCKRLGFNWFSLDFWIAKLAH